MATGVAFCPRNAENPRAVTLQLYLLRQILTALALTAGGIAFVVFPAVAVGAVQKLGGVSISSMLGYLPLVGMGLVPYLVPMAFLLAVVSVFGRMAAQNEWTAIRMARVHPFRMLIPPLLVAAGLGAGTYYLLATVVPNYKYNQTVYRRSTVIDAFKNLSPGRTELAFEDFYLNASHRPGPNSFAEVVLFLPGKTKAEDKKVVADLATFSFGDEDLTIELRNARTVIKGHSETTAEHVFLAIPLSEIFPPPDVRRSRGKYMTSEQLKEVLDSPEKSAATEPKQLANYAYVLNWRRALAMSYLLFVLLGAPIGIALRKGTQLAAMTAGVGVAFVYYVASLRLGEQIVEIGGVSPFLAVWSTNLIGATLGLVLCYRIVRR